MAAVLRVEMNRDAHRVDPVRQRALRRGARQAQVAGGLSRLCLIALAWRARADLPLVVAANRDEWRERPARAGALVARPSATSSPAATCRRAARGWASRAPAASPRSPTSAIPRTSARPRARAAGWSPSSCWARDRAEALPRRASPRASREYNGFNLIVGDGESLCYFGSREGAARAIEPGVHGLSNHLLDEPWPKVVRARMAMQQALRQRRSRAAPLRHARR